MAAALIGPFGDSPRLRVYSIFPHAPVRALIISNARSGYLLRAFTVSVIPTELSTGLMPPATTAGNGKSPMSKPGGRAARIERRIHWPPQNIAERPVAKIWIASGPLTPGGPFAYSPDLGIISTNPAPATRAGPYQALFPRSD